MAVRSILPPASTALERAVDESMPRGWGALADTVEPASLANHPAMLPWVAQQWQLGQFDRYFPTTRALLDAGLPWLRERGSAAAVRRALAWIGYTRVVLEEDGARLHINPGREVTNADLARMAHVVRASIPLHVAFYRVFYRYDLRLLRWDSRPTWDAALWDNHSGTPVDVGDGGPPIIGSQGRFSTSLAQAPQLVPVRLATHVHQASRMRRPDSMRLDMWRWDGATQHTMAWGQWLLTAAVLPAYLRLQPHATPAEARAATATPRPAAVINAEHGHTLGAVSPRMTPPRKWSGRWDGRPWRAPSIRSKTTETTD